MFNFDDFDIDKFYEISKEYEDDSIESDESCILFGEILLPFSKITAKDIFPKNNSDVKNIPYINFGIDHELINTFEINKDSDIDYFAA